MSQGSAFGLWQKVTKMDCQTRNSFQGAEIGLLPLCLSEIDRAASDLGGKVTYPRYAMLR